MMSNASGAPGASEKFFKFLFALPNAERFVRTVGAPAAIQGAVNEQSAFPRLIEAVQMINNTRSYPWLDNAVNILIADAFMRGSQAVVSGDMTIDQVLADVRLAAEIVRNEARSR